MTTKAVKQYDAIATEYAKKIAHRENKRLLELFEKYVQIGSLVLDAGCAAGRDAKILSAKGYHVIGIDLSKKLLSIARKENPTGTYEIADIRTLPFETNSFDAVWATAVIHHLEKKDMPKALQEFYRVLKKNGILFITTKRGTGQMHVKEELSLNEERVFTLLTEQELADMLEKTGYEKKEFGQTKSIGRDVFWIYAVCKK